jgi:hypothetical protein
MSIDTRIYTTRRMGIVEALAKELRNINGAFPYESDLEGRVEPRLKFWDEVQEFPSIHLNAGSETRDYQGGGYKDRYMNLTIRCYVNQEDAVSALEGLLEDVETVLETSSRLAYKDRTGATQTTQLITIISIDTDEGVLEPLGVGEVICEVRY